MLDSIYILTSEKVNTVSFFNRDSLHTKLNSHYKAWSYKKKKYKKITDLSTLVASPCITWFYCLCHGLMVGSAFIMVLPFLSGFSLILIVF